MAKKTVVGLFICCMELFMVQTFKSLNYAYEHDEDFSEGYVSVQTQEAWLGKHQKYFVYCGKDAVKVVLPSGPLSDVKVSGLEATEECVYSLTKERGNHVLRVSFSGCYVAVEDGRYVLRLMYQNNMGPAEVATVSCDVKSDQALQKLRFTRSNGQSDYPPASILTVTLHQNQPQNYTREGCDGPTSQRLPCGPSEITPAECMNKGCCVDVTDSSCYYPMDQCTADGQFVFSIYSNVTTIPVNPRSLIAGIENPCQPVHATSKFATFKFPVTKCGTKKYNIGDTTIYMAEVRTAIRTLNLKYGIITRDHPVRLMIECRYSRVNHTRVSATTGYMVVSPSVPASVRSNGLYGVQLRITEDETFTSFSPRSHLPLKVLLGRPLYLEVRLNSPNPEATLLVHYCVAYTRSATNALVLLYEGCPNPQLFSAKHSFLYLLDLPQTPSKRHFVVTAFQFMNVATQKYINEEIYFMCSTEVCMPSETPCRKTCFDGKA